MAFQGEAPEATAPFQRMRSYSPFPGDFRSGFLQMEAELLDLIATRTMVAGSFRREPQAVR